MTRTTYALYITLAKLHTDHYNSPSLGSILLLVADLQ